MEQQIQLIKVILLSNGQLLITGIEEVPSELGEPDCKLIDPYIIDPSNMELDKWMQSYSPPEVNNFMIHSDKIITLFTPKATLLEKYQEILK